MNVAEFQLHLNNLSALLHPVKSKTADELAEFAQGLSALGEKKLADLLRLMQQAEQIIQQGPPTRPSKPSAKASPEKLANCMSHIATLYQTADRPEVTDETISAAFAELDAIKHSQADLEELGLRIGIVHKIKPKAKLMQAIRQAVLDQKGAALRRNL